MTKESLLVLIDKAIVIGKEKQQHEREFPFLFQNAVDMLNDIKQEIINDVPPEKPYNSATSLGVYAVKEVDLFDRDYSLVLCNIRMAYYKYYHLESY